MSRALRSLSSCYVERRSKLAHGAALNTAGKRAAFALFYGPLHFLVTGEIVTRDRSRALRRAHSRSWLRNRRGRRGVGTRRAGGASINGVDKHPWAVSEASWTYRQFGITGYAGQGDMVRAPIRGRKGHGILAAYSINEIDDEARGLLLAKLVEARSEGAHVLVIEPIAKRALTWWSEWQERFMAAGGRADEWRFRIDLPERQRLLGRAAGLDPRELTARIVVDVGSLWVLLGSTGFYQVRQGSFRFGEPCGTS